MNHTLFEFNKLSKDCISILKMSDDNDINNLVKYGKVHLYSLSRSGNRRGIGIISHIDIDNKFISIFTSEKVAEALSKATSKDIVIEYKTGHSLNFYFRTNVVFPTDRNLKNDYYISVLSKESNNKPELKIRYHREKYPTLPDVAAYGNFVDLYNAEEVTLTKGEFKLLDLGISVEIPKGYWMQIVPRSSTFKKYSIIQTNSFGVIDTEYCGDDDILMLPVLSTRDIVIPKNERICQFRLVKDIEINITSVDKLENENRGGFGSTGKN